MRVFYRFTLILLFTGFAGALSAQSGPVGVSSSPVKIYRAEAVYRLNVPGNTMRLPSFFDPQGAWLLPGFSKNSLSGSKKHYVGDSKTLTVNGPVESGSAIVVSGKGLYATSVNIDILDTDGNSIDYKETEVIFNLENQQLSISTALKPGIYTLHIPVSDGMVNKTVIVQ